MNLRDRIAAALKRVDEAYLSKPEPFMAEPASYEDLADAVIEELGIRDEYLDSGKRRRTRVASDWERSPE